MHYQRAMFTMIDVGFQSGVRPGHFGTSRPTTARKYEEGGAVLSGIPNGSFRSLGSPVGAPIPIYRGEMVPKSTR